MRGSPSQKISPLGGLGAEKQLKKEVFCPFFQNPRWPTCFFFGRAFLPDPDNSDAIIHLV